MPKLSAVDSVTPAIDRTKWIVLPFRLGTWLVLGVIGLLAGEMSSGGGFNAGFPTSFPGHEKLPPTGAGGMPAFHFPPGSLMFLVIVAVVIVMFGLAFMYIASRFRFILFDTVIHGRADIGRGWSSYVQQANRYFVFSVVYALAALGILALLIGVPVWHAFKSGVFSGGSEVGPIFALIGSVLVALLLFGLAGYLISTMFRDFVATSMAVDNVTLGQAWSAAFQIVRNEPGAFALYLLMKIVLAVVCGIITGFAAVICFFILLIPAGIVALILVAIGMALKSMVGIGIVIALGVVAFVALISAMLIVTCVLNAPVAVFFESYRLCFLAGRNPRLEVLLWPALAAQPPPV
jgi:hypothetical protein